MSNVVETIKFGIVNSYLIKEGENFFMIDSGLSSKRAELNKRLESADCRRGNFKLIILLMAILIMPATDHTCVESMGR